MDKQELKMQTLLTEMEGILNVMADLAEEMGLERLPWRSGYIHFGTGGKRAVNPPVINDEYWSASTADCYPADEFNRWMYGDNEEDWKRGYYDDDGNY